MQFHASVLSAYTPAHQRELLVNEHKADRSKQDLLHWRGALIRDNWMAQIQRAVAADAKRLRGRPMILERWRREFHKA